MSWTLIDTATEHDSMLEFYRKDGLFMIRTNGLELMNGFHHGSETVLGQRAAQAAPAHAARVLVGGLGLGYTVAALTEALGPGGAITVAELSGSVIGWFERYVRPTVLPTAHANLTIVHTDVTALLAAGNRYDVAVLDVDNGPEPLVTESNAVLYSPVGLAALHASLAENGVALLWSGFESDAFVARAIAAGFTVTCEPFRRTRADLSHFIYVLEKNPATAANNRADTKN